MQGRQRCQRSQGVGVEFDAPAVADAGAGRVAAAFHVQPVAAELQLGLQRGRRRRSRLRVGQRELAGQRHAGQQRALHAQAAIAGHALGQGQRLQILGLGRQQHIELPVARQAVRALAPGAAGFTGPPRQRVEVLHRAFADELAFAAPVAPERGAEVGACRAGLGMGALQFQTLAIGAANELQLHGLRRAVGAALQVQLPGRAEGRRRGVGLQVGRRQALQRGGQRAAERHRRGAAVEALRGDAVEFGVQRQRVALPEAMARPVAGAAAGVGQCEVERLQRQPLGRGQLAAQFQS